MQVQVLSPSPLGVVGEAPVSCEITAGRPGRPPSTAGISSLRHARGGEAGGHGRARCEKAFLDEPEGPFLATSLLFGLCSVLSELLELSQLSQDFSCLVGQRAPLTGRHPVSLADFSPLLVLYLPAALGLVPALEGSGRI